MLKPGGVCIISVRDYDAVERAGVFQVWELRGDLYDLSTYFTFDDGAQVDTRVFRSTYYAVSISRLIQLMREAGFVNVERIDEVFFQPLIVGNRLSSAAIPCPPRVSA